MNGKSGLFPSNFVKELEASGEDGEPTDAVADETGGEDAASQRATLVLCFLGRYTKR